MEIIIFLFLSFYSPKLISFSCGKLLIDQLSFLYQWSANSDCPFISSSGLASVECVEKTFTYVLCNDLTTRKIPKNYVMKKPENP